MATASNLGKRSLNEDDNYASAASLQPNKQQKDVNTNPITGQDVRFALHYMALAAKGVEVQKQQQDEAPSKLFVYGYMGSQITNSGSTRYYCTILSESYRVNGNPPANASELQGRIFRIKNDAVREKITPGNTTSSINWADAVMLQPSNLQKIPATELTHFPRAHGRISTPRNKTGTFVQVMEFPAAGKGDWRNVRGLLLPVANLKGANNLTEIPSLLKNEMVQFQIGLTPTGEAIAFNLERATLLNHLNRVDGVDEPVESTQEMSFRHMTTMDKHYTPKVYKTIADETLKQHQKEVANAPFILVQGDPTPGRTVGDHIITIGDLNKTCQKHKVKKWTELSLDQMVGSYYDKLVEFDESQQAGNPTQLAKQFQSDFHSSKSKLTIIFDVDTSKEDMFSGMAFTAVRASFAKAGSAGHKYAKDAIITKRIDRPIPGKVAATNGGSCFSQSACPALASIHLDPIGYYLPVVQYDTKLNQGKPQPEVVGKLHAHCAIIKYSAEAIGAVVTEHPLGDQGPGSKLGHSMRLDSTRLTVLYKEVAGPANARLKEVITELLQKGMMNQTYSFVDAKYLVLQTLKRLNLVTTPAARQEVISRLIKAGATVSSEKDVGKDGITLRTKNGIKIPKEAIARKDMLTTMLDPQSFHFAPLDPSMTEEDMLTALGIEVSDEGQNVTLANKGNSPWGEIITSKLNTLLGVPTSALSDRGNKDDTIYIQGFTSTYGPEGVMCFIKGTLLKDTEADCTVVDTVEETLDSGQNTVYVRFLQHLSGAPGAHQQQYTMALTRRSSEGKNDTLLQVLKSKAGEITTITNGQYREQLNGLHWLKVHSSVPSLTMCQPQAFEEWTMSSAQTVEASQQQQSDSGEPAPSPNHPKNKGGYQSLFDKEDKTAPAPRAAEENDFPVQDTLLKNWLNNKVKTWGKLSTKQFNNLHKDLVTIYTCQNPTYHKNGNRKIPMCFTANGNTIGHQLNLAMRAGVQVNTILSMLANKTTICNLTNGTKVAAGVAAELGKMVMAVGKTKSKAAAKKSSRTAHGKQAGVASDDDAEDMFVDMTVSQPVAAAEEPTASQDTTPKPSASTKNPATLPSFFKPAIQPAAGKDKNTASTPSSQKAAPSVDLAGHTRRKRSPI